MPRACSALFECDGERKKGGGDSEDPAGELEG